MARTRSIKPGFYQNEDVAACSLAARLLYPGLWIHADKTGTLEDRPMRLKAQIFPFDNFDVDALLSELERNGLIVRYEVDGRKYIHIPTFKDHQHTHKAEEPKGYPMPPPNKHRTSTEQAPGQHGANPPVICNLESVIGNRVTGNSNLESGDGFASANPCPPDGEPPEPAPKPQPAKPSKPAADRSDEIRAVFAHYRTYHPKSFPKPASTSKEWGLVRARLQEGFSVADLCDAIDGCHRSPFHCGENDRGRAYQSLELIVRNASKVSEFMEVPRRGTGPPVLTEKNQRNLRAMDEWLARTQHDDTERETGLCLGFDGTGSGVPNGGRSGDP